MRNRRSAERAVETIETTVGELIETIMQVALELGNTEEEGYQLTSIALNDLLKRNHKELHLGL